MAEQPCQQSGALASPGQVEDVGSMKQGPPPNSSIQRCSSLGSGDAFPAKQTTWTFFSRSPTADAYGFEGSSGTEQGMASASHHALNPTAAVAALRRQPSRHVIPGSRPGLCPTHMLASLLSRKSCSECRPEGPGEGTTSLQSGS